MTALPRGRGGRTRLGMTLAAAVLLAACSTPPATTPTTAQATEPAGSQPSAASASPTATPIDLPLASTWIAATPGYRLDLTDTSRPGVFDGRFAYRAKDGAVRGQRVVTITVVAEDAVEVRWPDGRTTPGRLAAAADGRTELALDPGCLDYLLDGSSQVDCRLYPADEFAPESASASPSPTTSSPPPPPPAALPDADEALGYLCSVNDPTKIDHVTGPDADPYATAVLQQALIVLGADPGEVDGTYRGATRRAVRDFQAAAGLAVDGLVGPRTWTALQGRVCTLPSDPAGS